MNGTPSRYGNRLWRTGLAIWLAAAAVHLGQAQAVHPITGRRIAPVMGVSGADWLDRDERQTEEQPDKALAVLDLRPGMSVGDVGAGTGFYSIRMAQLVGPTGMVYSNDIQSEMLDRLRANAAARQIRNITPVLGTESDTHLPVGKLDLVLLVDVYHEFSRPQRMLESIRDSLKPNGRLVLLEYRKEDSSVPIRPEHKMSVAEVKAEVIPEGYQFDKVIEKLPWQHIICFRKTAP